MLLSTPSLPPVNASFYSQNSLVWTPGETIYKKGWQNSMAPFKPHDAAVPLGSGMEVDVADDHGPMAFGGQTTPPYPARPSWIENSNRPPRPGRP